MGHEVRGWIGRAGVLAWSLIGVLGVLVVALWAASQIAVVLVPLLVATRLPRNIEMPSAVEPTGLNLLTRV